jgi:3-oxoadipate enol-lactonase
VARMKVGELELAYDLSGSGRDVVWGHGLSSSRAREDAIDLVDWPALAERCRLLRYDARGHGESTLATDLPGYSWDSLARDQLALTAALGMERYVAAGASMGCGTALHAAVAAPDRVEALVLVIPPTAWETRQERVAIWDQVATIIEADGVEAFIANMARMPVPDPLQGRQAWFDANAASARRTGPARLATVFRGAGHADLPPRAEIARLRVPTLILAWTGDPGHPVSTAEALAELVPGAELVLSSTWSEVQGWTGRIAAFLEAL